MSDMDRSRGDLATKPLQPDKSLGELFGELTSEMGTLFRKEVELAKLEAKDELKQGGKAAGMFAGAGLGGWMAVLFLSLALAWLLDQAMNTALAFAIVGVLWAVVAAVLAASGKKKMAAVKPLPQTTQTLKEDAQWAKTQKS
jgi:F0F1-type ATP synthase assembly protein I